MAHAARRPTPSNSTHAPRARRLRRQVSTQAAGSRSPGNHCVSRPTLSSSDIEQPRPVLVPLHPNLRRLPSRLLLAQKVSKEDTHSAVMRQHSYGSLRAGAKRKRVFSANENTTYSGRCTRNSERSKRLRSSHSSDEDDPMYQSGIDVDVSINCVSGTDESEDEELCSQNNEDSVSDEESTTDEYLINFADQKQLTRLRKTNLIRLYNLAGLTEDPETLTKPEIISALIDARDDYVSVPPSSLAGKSTDYSSDDGNVAGDEDTDGFDPTDVPALNLRRRATIHELGNSSTVVHKGRSFSLGTFTTHIGNSQSKTRYRSNSNVSAGSRSKASISPSPTSTVGSNSWPVRSPPATRLRSRQVSQNVGTKVDSQTSPTSGHSSPGQRSKAKAKGKHVGFRSDVEVHLKTSARRCKDETLPGGESDMTELSDLTELSELEKPPGLGAPQPSPRRLRSKNRQRSVSDTSIPSQSHSTLRKRRQTSTRHDQNVKQNSQGDKVNGPSRIRVLPTRKVKLKPDSAKEPVDEHEEDEDELAKDDESEEIGSQDEEAEDENEAEEDDDEENDEENDNAVAEVDQSSEEEEVDELASTASVTSSPKSRRTPLRKRLRPRRKQGSTGPDDGDDEGDGGRVPHNQEVEMQDAEDENPDSVDEDDEEADDEETIAVEPRRLRNGKIVGEEDVDMDIAEEEEDIGEESEQNEDDGDVSGDTHEQEDECDDEDVEGDTDGEIMDEEVDLTVATAKTLVRLRRDDLVRLCESHDLEPVGTKPQLAQALLQWRDRQCSSPSSTGTVRPPSTTKRRRYHTRNHSNETQTPILSRSHRVHLDEPRTPVLEKDQEKEKEGEQDLELDLGSLGLDDREIPPEKLQKLEKIGSGGFKDVFIGKFKGRKIAIAEFRGQLNAMDIKELKLLGEFDHPNIVRFLGVSIPENTRETPVMIVSELCSNGDLFDYIRNVNAPPLRKTLVIMLDIARGLEYLHTRRPSVIHRDCKSSNILITSKGTAKIADFGLAKVKQSTRSMVRSLVGTVNWQAPELWHAHPKYNHKVDVFSCAMVFWEMLQWHQPKANRKFPWEGMNEHAIYDLVGTKRQRPSVTGLKKQWCPELIDLVEAMWKHDPQDRPTMSEVVETLEDLVASS